MPWARHLAWLWFDEAALFRRHGCRQIPAGRDLVGAVVEKVADALAGNESAFSGNESDAWLLG